MKFPLLITLSLCLWSTSVVTSQTMDWTRQIIIVNSGKFEFAPPYNDFVTAQSYNPATQAVSEFNTIFTQSAQDILITGNIAFVTSQDSIIKYNLNTYKRLAAIADSGLSKLAIFHNRLCVSKQYPLAKFFMEVLDTANLSLVAMVDNIPGDCGGITSVGDTVYLAVNGGWMGTEGKIAVIDPGSWTLKREINLGPEAIGIYNLYRYGNKIYSVNKTPYGMPAAGSISVYDPTTGVHHNQVINVKIGNGTGIKDSTLYFMMNEGIGSFRLRSMQIADTTIVPDPGSAMFKYILSSVMDTLNNRIYCNVGDFATPGLCLVSDLSGDSVTSFPTGISSDVVGIDYREFPQGISNLTAEGAALSVFPNPVVDRMTIRYEGKQQIEELLITDAYGKTVYRSRKNPMESGFMCISIEKFPAGLYLLMVNTPGNLITTKFIKR